MKNNRCSKFSNLSNWKEEAWKNQGFNGIQTRDLMPWFFQASSFQLLKLENLLRWSFFTFNYFHLPLQFKYELFHIYFTSESLHVKVNKSLKKPCHPHHYTEAEFCWCFVGLFRIENVVEVCSIKLYVTFQIFRSLKKEITHNCVWKGFI